MSPEERESIINEAVERAIKLTPDLARELVNQRMSEDRLRLIFLEKLIGEDPRYKKYASVIKSIVEKKEAENPGNIQKALDDAAPEIKDLIGKIDKMDFKSIPKPSDTTFKGDDRLGNL